MPLSLPLLSYDAGGVCCHRPRVRRRSVGTRARRRDGARAPSELLAESGALLSKRASPHVGHQACGDVVRALQCGQAQKIEGIEKGEGRGLLLRAPSIVLRGPAPARMWLGKMVCGEGPPPALEMDTEGRRRRREV